MTNKAIQYSFQEINKCNMCGSPSHDHKVLGKRLNRSQGMWPRKKTGITTTIVKCNSCGLIYANPLPLPINIQTHYGVQPESYWKKEYFTLNDAYFMNEINTFKKLQPVTDGLRSLDIGAGLGKCMIALSNAGFDAYGLEASESFYTMAIEKMRISKDKLTLTTLEDAGYSDNFFDFITFGAVLEHLYDPAASITRAMKWLKPKGLMHIEVPSSAWLTSKIINAYYKLTLSDFTGNLSPMHEPYHLYEFSLKSFREHALKNGYEIAFHEYLVCRTYLPKAFDFIFKPYMKWTNTGMQLCVWLRKK